MRQLHTYPVTPATKKYDFLEQRNWRRRGAQQQIYPKVNPEGFHNGYEENKKDTGQ